MDELENKTTFFPLPYALAVSGQTSVRPKEDFWRLRVVAAVLRGSPVQVKNYKERYNSDLN